MYLIASLITMFVLVVIVACKQLTINEYQDAISNIHNDLLKKNKENIELNQLIHELQKKLRKFEQ